METSYGVKRSVSKSRSLNGKCRAHIVVGGIHIDTRCGLVL
jgi:hypothetical protein